jgi:hypothetical protein
MGSAMLATGVSEKNAGGRKRFPVSAKGKLNNQVGGYICKKTHPVV